jgi:hypothetical protein
MLVYFERKVLMLGRLKKRSVASPLTMRRYVVLTECETEIWYLKKKRDSAIQIQSSSARAPE